MNSIESLQEGVEIRRMKRTREGMGRRQRREGGGGRKGKGVREGEQEIEAGIRRARQTEGRPQV